MILDAGIDRENDNLLEIDPDSPKTKWCILWKTR